MTRNRWTWPLVTMLALAPLAIGAGTAIGEAIDAHRADTADVQTTHQQATEATHQAVTDPPEEPTMSATQPPDVRPTATRVPTRGRADVADPAPPAPGQGPARADVPEPTPTPEPEPTGEPEATPEPVPTKAPDRAVKGDYGVWWCYPADGSDPYPCP